MFLTKKSICSFLSAVSITTLCGTSSLLLVDARKMNTKASKTQSPVSSAPTNNPTPVPMPVPVPVSGKILIVENIGASLPDGGSIVLSLGENALTGKQSLVGGQIITRAVVFPVDDIAINFDAVDGSNGKGTLDGEIDDTKQIGFTTNVCTVTQGRFNLTIGEAFIETAQCSATTCLGTAGESCFFSQYGGFINVDAIQNTLGTEPEGIITGGTGLFRGVAGTFKVTKLVESTRPTTAEEIATSVLQVSFVLNEYDDPTVPFLFL